MTQETRKLLTEQVGDPKDYGHSQDIKDINLVWDYMESLNLFTNEELQLVTSINGYNMETLDNMLYARFGYRDIEQYIESEGV